MNDEPAEYRHDPPPDRLWNESWYFDFANSDLDGGYIRLGLYPNLAAAWWWGYLVIGDRLIVVRDHAAPLPPGTDLEIRTPEMSAEVVCEKPMVRWSLAMEARGVELADPADAYKGEPGPRVPVGLELSWEALTPPFWYPTRATSHYQHAGRVGGEITIGDNRFAFEGTGERDHSWGVRDWWAVPWHWASFQIGQQLAAHVLQVRVGEQSFSTGYIARGGAEPEAVRKLEVTTQLGADDIPVRASYVLEDLPVEVTVECPAPVPLESPDGKFARFPRALCRFETPEGAGVGWAEWLQPSSTES